MIRSSMLIQPYFFGKYGKYCRYSEGVSMHFTSTMFNLPGHRLPRAF